MPTPPAAQGAPSWCSSSGGGGATSSASSASPSYSSDPSSPSSPEAAPLGLDPTSSGAGAPSSSASPPPPPSCAACRHQRRRCEPGCLLKPYFATDEPERFRNALRMFGVKNLQRMLRAVPPPRRGVCVRTVVYESNLRAADPVRGCCGAIQDLESQLMDTAVELEVLRRRLESYRQLTSRGSGQQAKTSGDDVRTQGPYGVAPAPAAANELAATEPLRLSATEMAPQLPQVQPQLSTMPP